jgi:hypothetical protein
MSSKTRTSLLSLTVIAVLIFSAIGPTIVYADDSQPPDTTASQTIDSDSGSDNGQAAKCDSDKGAKNKDKKGKKNKSGAKHWNKCSSEEEAADTSGGEGTAGVDVAADTSGSESGADAAVADATGGDSAEAAPADTNLISEVPENTSVTVLNADGQPEPLATQEAAAAIATTTDPIWCPQGQAPTPGANGCTPSFTSFTDLLTFLAANATTFQGAGTIYVEQGAYGGGESVIDFNAYNLSNISSSNLTVQGGWDTTPNPVDPATAGTSDFGVSIIIGSSANPWGGSLTINNLVITGPDQTGLTLYSLNDINVSNVEVTNSVNGGGAELEAGVNVSINNSKFLRNNTAGATIRAEGNVAVANSDFSNTFNQRRQIKGLDITSAGSVSLFNVLANGNRRVGADINAGGRVTIGSSVFSETNALNSGVFYGYGLRVVTPDAIDLAFVTANNNFLWGADLDAGGDVNISDSIFNANSTSSPTFIDDTGLLVTSGGAVTLNRVEASGNRLIGAVIDAAGVVNINSSTFSNNQGVITTGGVSTFHGLGLGVVSLSSIFLNAVTASGNGLTGASLDGGGITITNGTFSNNTTGSSTDLLGNGLLVVGAGNVVLFNVTMDGNQLNGGTIQTAANTTLDSVTATNNGGNGVEVEAACTHLNGGAYSGNGQYGLNLVSSPLDLVSSPTFGNNGAGDIFPATPATCAPIFPIFTSTNPVTITSQGSSSNANASSLQQAVSYIPLTGDSASATSLLGASLNSLFSGITREVTSNSVVTSIFVGQYIYVYTIFTDDSSIDNLQIIVLSPAPLTGVAMVGP